MLGSRFAGIPICTSTIDGWELPRLLICEELAPSRDQIGPVADIRSVWVAAGMGLSTGSVLRNLRRHLRRSRLYLATSTARPASTVTHPTSRRIASGQHGRRCI